MRSSLARPSSVNPIRVGRATILGSSQLATAKVGIANRNLGVCNILTLTDSIGEGTGATVYDRSWTKRMLAGLRQRYPQAAAGGIGYIPLQYASGTFTQPVTLSGGAVFGGGSATGSGNSFGLGCRSVTFSASGHTATYVVTGVTRVDLHWTAQTSGGTVSYTITGSNPVSTTNIVTSGTQGNGSRTTLLSGISAAGTNTIVITWVSGSSAIDGLMNYNGDETTGIRLWEAGHSGFNSGSFNYNSSYWGTTVQNFCQPSLCVIELGTNDWGTATPIPISTMVTNLASLVTKVRSRSVVSPSIVFVPVYERQPAVTTLDSWANYVAAIRNLAISDGDIAVCDLFTRMGTINSTGTNSRGILSDLVHPSDKGHQMVADLFVDWLAASLAQAQYA